MGRYDRIERLDAPPRETAFDGWLSLRDLEGREREPELGRRALLRFLALRPVRRLLIRGLEVPGTTSLNTQVQAVRAELDRLPPDDADRQRLARYLEEIGGRSPAGLVRATLDVAAAAEAGGHLYAAEEFCRTALELTAKAHGSEELRPVALRQLGRVLRQRGEWSAAEGVLREAVECSEDAGDRTEWARSMEALSAVSLRRGRADEARSILADISGGEDPDPAVAGIGAAGRCALELAEGRPEAALEAGWAAVRLLAPDDETRNRVLLNMAAAFRRLGLGPAAASCYEIVVRWAPWPEHRIEARLEHAIVAAESGDDQAFTDRRAAVLDGLEPADRPLRAMVHLGLGRGALLIGDRDSAQEHLRETVSTARDLGLDDILAHAEELLGVADGSPEEEPSTQGSPTAGVHQIAGRIESLAERDSQRL